MKRYLIISTNLIALFATAHARAIPAAYAIVIGNNQPPPGTAGADLQTLRYADDDAVRYYQFFKAFTRKTWLIAGLDQETQNRYPGLAARSLPVNSETLIQSIKELASNVVRSKTAGERTVFYFIFSGHGAISDNGEAFLSVPGRNLTRTYLYNEIIKQVPSDATHIIVDSCYAEAIVGTRKIFGREVDAKTTTVTSSEARQLIQQVSLRQFPKVGAIIATTSNQEAHEWSKIQSGVFTHEILSGLYGAADINSDGKIEYTELHAFVASANRKIRDSRARPKVVSFPPRQNLSEPLVSYRWFRHQRRLVGNFSRLGHFYVERLNGQRFIEAHLQSPYKSELILPEAGTVFLRTKRSETEVRKNKQGTIKLASLSFHDRQIQERGSVEAAYRTALFAAPFTPTYYQGYVDSTGGVSVQFSQLEGEVIKTQRSASSTRKYVGWSLVGIGTVSAIAALTTGILCFKAKSDFDETTKQREAHDANQRYINYGTASIVTGGVAIGSALLAWWLWPKSHNQKPGVSAYLGPNRDFSLGMSWSW